MGTLRMPGSTSLPRHLPAGWFGVASFVSLCLSFLFWKYKRRQCVIQWDVIEIEQINIWKTLKVLSGITLYLLNNKDRLFPFLVPHCTLYRHDDNSNLFLWLSRWIVRSSRNGHRAWFISLNVYVLGCMVVHFAFSEFLTIRVAKWGHPSLHCVW